MSRPQPATKAQVDAGETDERGGWRPCSDLRYGVLGDVAAHLPTVETAVVVGVMLEPGRWHPQGQTHPHWATVNRRRIGTRMGISPLTVDRTLRRLVRAGRWLQRHGDRWRYGVTYGPELRASVMAWRGRGGLRHTWSPHDMGSLLEEAQRIADGGNEERWAWPDALLLVARTVAAGSTAVYDGTQRRLAELVGINEADTCRSLRRLERLGVLRQGTRQMATEAGDPEPQAERLGNCLAHGMLRYCRHRSADKAGREWLASRARQVPDPELPGLERPRRRRMSRAAYWQAQVVRMATIRQRRQRQTAMARSVAPQVRPTPPLQV